MADNQDTIVALRCAQQHQVHLTAQADQKANINIGIVSLVAIFISNSKIAMATEADIIIKMGMVGFIAMVAISLVMALMVVMPRLGRVKNTQATEMSNPFYFGSFTQIPLGDYVDYMDNNLTNNDQAKRMLASDIYQIGQVLNRKYASLRISYVFLGLSVMMGVGLYSYAFFKLGL